MKAIIYARSATTKGGEEYNSVEHQLARLMSHCQSLKFQIAGVYFDIGSGANFNRPGWESLLKDLQNSTVSADIILCTSTDRLSRVKTETKVILEKLQHYGITLKCLEKPFNIWVELKKKKNQ
ncbi:MAG: recombinase family protein [Bacteroidetes bacterium]|nr:recombinase family protein [Bacteroidota bacterium]